MKPQLFLAAFVSLVISRSIHAAPAAPPPDPPELTALRESYNTAMEPLKAKVTDAIKKRSEQYAADLQKVEEQATAANKIEAVPLLRAEREAFASGGWTRGYSKDDKVPVAAQELRRAYDREINKIRADIVPAARPLLNDYLKNLNELERKLIAAKSGDAALAVRRQREWLQAASADPLNGTNSLVIGKWVDSKGKEITFLPTGILEGEAGKWSWTDRVARALRVQWHAGPRFYIDLVISPDGTQMSGVNATGGKRDFTRKQP